MSAAIQGNSPFGALLPLMTRSRPARPSGTAAAASRPTSLGVVSRRDSLAVAALASQRQTIVRNRMAAILSVPSFAVTRRRRDGPTELACSLMYLSGCCSASLQCFSEDSERGTEASS